MFTSRRFYYRKILLAILLTIFIITLYLVYDARKCDVVEQSKMVIDQNGKSIPLYSELESEKTFGELNTKCAYVNGEIDCKDVRHFGTTMNSRSILTLVRMVAVLDLICKKYDIPYWLSKGSLLGAVRAGRMIPWDMDIDVAVTHEGYKKLLKYIRKELPDDIIFQDGSDNPSYKRFPDAKLRDRNSCYGYCLRYGCQWEDGLEVDIFVYKKTKDNPTIIQNHFDKSSYNINDIHPIRNIPYEGIQVSIPYKAEVILKHYYGPNYTKKPPRNEQCSYGGFVAIPWYSCQYIDSLPKEKRTKVLLMGRDHRSPWFWYYG